jgi:hypothetical protein
MQDFTLADGTKVNLIKFYNAKIKDWDTAAEWLRSTNNDSIIKSGFAVSLGKGEADKGLLAVEALQALGIVVEINDKIHPSTLKSFVREQCEEGVDFPKEAFGVYEGKRVKIN